MKKLVYHLLNYKPGKNKRSNKKMIKNINNLKLKIKNKKVKKKKFLCR